MTSMFVLVFCIFIQNCITQKSPTITYISPNQIKDIGATVKLDCSVKNAGNYEVLWVKFDPIDENNVTFSIGSSLVFRDYRVSIHHNASTSTYTLQIQDIDKSDVGTYYCEITSSPEKSASVQLQVRQPPIILNNSTESILTIEGEDIQLECYADGYPTPTITWRRQNKKTFRTGNVIYQGNVLSIESVRKEDRGTYYCVADNEVGRDTRQNVNVMVEFAPLITVFNSTKSQALSYDQELSCRIEGYPLLEITWLKYGVPLPSHGQRHLILNYPTDDDDVVDTKLIIKSIEKAQYGKYVCRAANKLGRAKGEVVLLESNKPVCISFCDEKIITEDNNTTLPTNTTLES